MIVEVYLAEGDKLRLLSGSGPVSLNSFESIDDDVTLVASCDKGVPGCPSSYHRWSLEDVLETDVGVSPMDALADALLNIEVMLVDRKRNKMAVWYGRRLNRHG